MVKKFYNASIEVTVSRNLGGKFDVLAKPRVPGHISAQLQVIFGSNENFATFKYDSENPKNEWADVAGRHGEDVQDIKITSLISTLGCDCMKERLKLSVTNDI
jgi:hypothetical protein